MVSRAGFAASFYCTGLSPTFSILSMRLSVQDWLSSGEARIIASLMSKHTQPTGKKSRVAAAFQASRSSRRGQIGAGWWLAARRDGLVRSPLRACARHAAPRGTGAAPTAQRTLHALVRPQRLHACAESLRCNAPAADRRLRPRPVAERHQGRTNSSTRIASGSGEVLVDTGASVAARIVSAGRTTRRRRAISLHPRVRHPPHWRGHVDGRGRAIDSD